MSDAPVFHIDLCDFHDDPYPALAEMRARAPIAQVPELGATLLTRHDSIFVNEKRTDIFSSVQPDGLMTVLMGENMMRKDGDAHMTERRAIFPTISPRTVRDVWLDRFRAATGRVLDRLAPRGQGDLVADYALPVAAEALRVITGLTNMSNAEIDRVSQGMIDGIANYAGDATVEARCNDCTASIDRHIDEMIPRLKVLPDHSLLSVQMRAGLSDAQIRANIKLAISGGQNEPRDAIAGTIWALLTHPAQKEMVLSGEVTFAQAFEEYARWCSPIGMSPRRIARAARVEGVAFEPGDRAFLMFGSANRDEAVFDRPDRYDVTRDNRASMAFGAGPHFCAGAWAARALVAEVALPMAFERLRGLHLAPGSAPRPVGWAFRGLTELPCRWDAA